MVIHGEQSTHNSDLYPLTPLSPLFNLRIRLHFSFHYRTICTPVQTRNFVTKFPSREKIKDVRPHSLTRGLTLFVNNAGPDYIKQRLGVLCTLLSCPAAGNIIGIFTIPDREREDENKHLDVFLQIPAVRQRLIVTHHKP